MLLHPRLIFYIAAIAFFSLHNILDSQFTTNIQLEIPLVGLGDDGRLYADLSEVVSLAQVHTHITLRLNVAVLGYDYKERG